VSSDDGIVWKSEFGLLQPTLERDTGKQASFQNLGSSRPLFNVDSSLSCGQKLMKKPHPDFMKFGGNLIQVQDVLWTVGVFNYTQRFSVSSCHFRFWFVFLKRQVWMRCLILAKNLKNLKKNIIPGFHKQH